MKRKKKVVRKIKSPFALIGVWDETQNVVLNRKDKDGEEPDSPIYMSKPGDELTIFKDE
jgi:hypothetical protein